MEKFFWLFWKKKQNQARKKPYVSGEGKLNTEEDGLRVRNISIGMQESNMILYRTIQKRSGEMITNTQYQMLDSLFNYYNQELFDGKLSDCMIITNQDH